MFPAAGLPCDRLPDGDCLHDEGIAYAKALEEAGVEVQIEDVKGTFHGFDFFADKEIAKAMAEKRIQALRDAFHR